MVTKHPTTIATNTIAAKIPSLFILSNTGFYKAAQGLLVYYYYICKKTNICQQYIVIEQSALQVDLKHLYLIKSIQRKSRQMIHWLLPLTMKVRILVKNLLFQERRLQTVPQYTSDILMEKLFGHQFSLIRFISLQT